MQYDTRWVWLAAVLALASCESPLAPKAEPELKALPRQLTVSEQQVIQASNTFAFDILRETVRQQPAANTFLSPLSASMALGMTMNGARGVTLDGMRSTLGFGTMPLAEINPSYRDLIDLLLNLDRGVDMRIANSIWANEGHPFHQEFLDTNRQYFDAKVSTLQFGAPNAAATINAWVDQHTGGKIREIVENPIPRDVVMYLINAIYFKGEWRQRFERAQTHDAPFTLASGAQKQVRMMHRSGKVLEYYDPELRAQVVELLYGRGAFAMTIVLPAASSTLGSVIEAVSAERWQRWTDGLRETEAELFLPRFRLEYRTTMNAPLIALGMGAAFGVAPGTDFSGMSPVALEISAVKQKTYIDVNEEGTEAAAVTSVGVRVVSAPPSIRIDRPFLLALRERLSGTILFLGAIGEPNSQ